MSMIEKKNIGEVEVKDNQIIFTDKDQKNIYKTGLMNDLNLTDRLYAVSYTHLYGRTGLHSHPLLHRRSNLIL